MIEPNILLKQLAREKRARKEAEEIAEKASRVLYQANVELKKLSETLSDKERNTRAILEATADSIISFDEHHQVIMCNQAACKLFGYETHELMGMHLHELVTTESKEAYQEIELIFSHSTNMLYELIARPKNQILLPIEVAISRIKSKKDTLIICAMRNIFLRKQAQQFLSIRHKISHVLAEHASLVEAIPQILKIICKEMKLDSAIFWQVNDIEKVLNCVESWCVPLAEIEEFNKLSSKEFTFSPGVGLPGRVWQSKEPCWIKDVTKDDNFPRAKIVKKTKLRTAFAFPVLFENEVLAVIEFYMENFHPLDKNLIDTINDITSQLGIFIEHEQIQKKITDLSRLAGMAEVSSGILHNVGNTLNSVTTSIDLLSEQINYSKMDDLTLIAQLLQENKANLADFFFHNKRAQALPEFLTLLAESWAAEKNNLYSEINLLKKNIDHVKSVIQMQQSFTYLVGATEEISIKELLNNTLTLNKIEQTYKNIHIIREFSLEDKKTIVDKVKLFQIFVNLVKNAVESLLESRTENKQLILRLKKKDNLYFTVQVCDNGLGILPENIKKIFSHGFTTKKMATVLGSILAHCMRKK